MWYVVKMIKFKILILILIDYGTAIELEQMKLVLSERKGLSILELYVGV